MKLEEQEQRRAAREGRSMANSQPQPQRSQEGYLSYMQRQVTDRTERLGLSNDHMDRLEENSSNFVNDVNKYVQNQKRKAVFGGKITSAHLAAKDFANHIYSIGLEVWVLMSKMFLTGAGIIDCLLWSYSFSTAYPWLISRLFVGFNVSQVVQGSDLYDFINT